MTALVQLEYDRARHPTILRTCGAARSMAEKVLEDTLANGGTMVLVVTDEKMTLVQRDDCEHPGDENGITAAEAARNEAA